ncbi:MAG: ABC transporter substrate-binding protein [Phycisphaerae bacterium]
MTLAGISLVAVAGPPATCARPPDPPPRPSARENYGRTPDTVIPYRHFREPYRRFFQKTPLYRGTGRAATPTTPVATVRIGVLAPGESAPDGDAGREMIDGITLAIEEANAAGGLRGIPFETVVREDTGAWGSTADETVAFRFSDQVLALIGSVDGANTHIALRAALKVQLPMVNTATTDPTLTETAIPWIMRCMADDRQQGYALAHHIFTQCRIKKVAAFRVNDRFGRMGIAEFRDAARRLKHPLRLELRWQRGDRDFSAQLSCIEQSGVEAVVLWGNAADTAAVVREIRRRKMPQRIFGCDRLVSSRFLDDAKDAAEGVVAVATFDPTRSDPRYARFRRAFHDRFGHEPGTFAAHAYDGANMLIEAIRTAGLNRVRVRDALYECRGYDGVTGRIEFDTTLNDIGPVYIATVRDGRYVYQPADFTKTARAGRSPRPYRTLADSPPLVRTARASVGSKNAKPKAIRIGCFLPLDEAGQAAARGLEMALAEEADRQSDHAPIELVTRDSRGTWGEDAGALTSLVADDDLLVLVGSTERRGTHLMETLAAKLHIPLISLCGDDPTIHAIPLPWVFSVAPADDVVDQDFARPFKRWSGSKASGEAAMGYDVGQLLIGAIHGGDTTRTAFRRSLATAVCHDCASGSFRFDGLGRRIDVDDPTQHTEYREQGSVVDTTRGSGGAERDP